jgi:hypothetical protein
MANTTMGMVGGGMNGQIKTSMMSENISKKNEPSIKSYGSKEGVPSASAGQTIKSPTDVPMKMKGA